MGVRVHKITLMVLDFEGTTDEDVQLLLEQNRHLNLSIISHEKLEEEIKWEDNNPLNLRTKQKEEFERLFREKKVEKVV